MKLSVAIIAVALSGMMLIENVMAEPGTETASSEISGAEIYKKHCASCHGNDGKGNPKMAAMLKTRIPDLVKNSVKKSDQELIKVIAQGQGKMPAYKDKLSREAQIAALTHIRTIASKETEKTPDK